MDKVAENQKKDNWLRLLCSGDQQAFARLIDKYKEMVFLCCRRLGLREDEIEDVASETFMAAYKGLSRYAGQSDLSTWLWGIAYRKAVSYLRKNRKNWQLKDELDEQISYSRSDGPAAAMQAEETEKIVWQAVEQLPRLWATAIILYYREQKCIFDIAKIMGQNENTIKTYLFRARARLKEMLAATFGADDADR